MLHHLRWTLCSVPAGTDSISSHIKAAFVVWGETKCELFCMLSMLQSCLSRHTSGDRNCGQHCWFLSHPDDCVTSAGLVGLRHHCPGPASRRPPSGAPDQPEQHPSRSTGPPRRAGPAWHQGHTRWGDRLHPLPLSVCLFVFVYTRMIIVLLRTPLARDMLFEDGLLVCACLYLQAGENWLWSSFSCLGFPQSTCNTNVFDGV